MSITTKFNKATFKDHIEQYPFRLKTLVGTSACQRLIECYSLFNRKTSFGDYELIKKTLSKIWTSIEKDDLPSCDAKALVQACELQVPDSEDFGDMLSTFAQNAVFSLCSVLDFLVDRNDENIVHSISFVVDTIDYLVQEVDQLDSGDPELESKILFSKLMQKELLVHAIELEKISSNKNIDELYFDFRRRSKEIGKDYLDVVKSLI